MEGFEENSVQKPYLGKDTGEPQEQQDRQQREVGLGFHSSPSLPCSQPNLDPLPPPYDLDKQSMSEEELRNRNRVDEEPLTQKTINEGLQNQGILNEELWNLTLGEEGTADADHGGDGNGEGYKRNGIDVNHTEVFNEEEHVKEEDEVADSVDDKNLNEDINDDTHLDDHDNGKTGNEEEGVEGSENVAEDSALALVSKDGRYRRYYYPLRPDAEDCSYYMRTGACKFGSNCKFNHPLRRKSQAAKEKVKENEENPEWTGQIECKYYLTSGGCKFGKACRYNHGQGKILVSPVLELNFLGLPIRPGEKECPYYMRNGSCKYGSNCRFNHPDPTAVGGGDTSGYENGGSVSLQGSSQSPMPPWSSPRTLNETAPFVPMMLSPNQGIPSPSSEWNGYQASVYPATERSLPTPPAFAMNSPLNETNFYPHHQVQVVVDDFPERPGQPECSYFLKTGDCKFRSGCKFHHPKNRNMKAPACTLSDKGLPLRPDQNICMHYSRYGICKFGPACKFDHPVNYANLASSVGSEPDHPSFGNYAGSGNGN